MSVNLSTQREQVEAEAAARRAAYEDKRRQRRARDARARRAARDEARRLEVERERLTEDLGRHAAAHCRGDGDEEAVEQVEVRLAEVGRALRRADAADRDLKRYT